MVARPAKRPRGDGEMREAILNTARDLLRRYGLRKTTMEDIATAMGKRKSFLYYYFPGKPEVMTALVERESMGMRNAIRAAVGSADNPVDRVRAYFSVRAEQLVKRLTEFHDPRFESLLGGETLDILQLADDRRRFDEDEFRYLADLILDGVRAKVFRPLSEKDVLAFCKFTLSALRGTEVELALNPSLVDGVESQMEINLEILFRGLMR